MSLSVGLIVLSALLAVPHTPQTVIATFMIALAWAYKAGVGIVVGRLAVLVPLIPIVISHFVVEPFPHVLTITNGRVTSALLAWVRLSGMTLISISWVRSMRSRDLAQLANMTGLGQYVFCLAIMTVTMLRLTGARWQQLRESICLERTGLLRHRRKLGLRQVAPAGLQLTLVSLAMTTDMALSAQGRGILRKRKLAVRVPVGIGLWLPALILLVIGAFVVLQSETVGSLIR